MHIHFHITYIHITLTHGHQFLLYLCNGYYFLLYLCNGYQFLLFLCNGYQFFLYLCNGYYFLLYLCNGYQFILYLCNGNQFLLYLQIDGASSRSIERHFCIRFIDIFVPCNIFFDIWPSIQTELGELTAALIDSCMFGLRFLRIGSCRLGLTAQIDSCFLGLYSFSFSADILKVCVILESLTHYSSCFPYLHLLFHI